MVTVELTADAVQQSARLPRSIQGRVRKILDRLIHWPEVSGVKSLSGNLAGWYRVRTGDYRIRFHIQGETLIVDKIGHRKDVYDS